MAGECSNLTCQKTFTDFIRETKEEMFGTGLEGGGMKGKLNELTLCIRSRVSRKFMIISLLALMAPATTLTVYSMAAWSQQRGNTTNNTKEIEKIQVEYKYISEQLKEVIRKQDAALTVDDIKGALEEVIKAERGKPPTPTVP
jgi:hypothetical protein